MIFLSLKENFIFKMKIIEVKDRQTVMDVALQYCGSAEAAFEICFLNDFSLSFKIEPGTFLKVPEATNQKIVDYYRVNKIEPATEDTETSDTNAIMSIGNENIKTINDNVNINTIN